MENGSKASKPIAKSWKLSKLHSLTTNSYFWNNSKAYFRRKTMRTTR